MSDSPTSRTMEYWRGKGYQIDIVERTIQANFTKKDYGGFADLIAYNAEETVAIQSTTIAHITDRTKKVEELETTALEDWVAGKRRRFVVQGWGKRGSRGQRKLWRTKIVEYSGKHSHLEGRWPTIVQGYVGN